ncbi:hypothetical protein BD410DRAFT_845075 [Rickenella mellea]|uniref:Uncharacterized protein n=1 Tax=Rickenella mellea TaxID=50990 RepID=A0A4Y7PK62_9AGAM|nr:hypothetical protein BD410DRAFT_845075 [Rickenella mellea]
MSACPYPSNICISHLACLVSPLFVYMIRLPLILPLSLHLPALHAHCHTVSHRACRAPLFARPVPLVALVIATSLPTVFLSSRNRTARLVPLRRTRHRHTSSNSSLSLRISFARPVPLVALVIATLLPTAFLSSRNRNARLVPLRRTRHRHTSSNSSLSLRISIAQPVPFVALVIATSLPAFLSSRNRVVRLVPLRRTRHCHTSSNSFPPPVAHSIARLVSLIVLVLVTTLLNTRLDLTPYSLHHHRRALVWFTTLLFVPARTRFIYRAPSRFRLALAHWPRTLLLAA